MKTNPVNSAPLPEPCRFVKISASILAALIAGLCLLCLWRVLGWPF